MKDLNINDMEKINGGVYSPFFPIPRRLRDDKKFIKEENDKPKDGGATGGW